MRAGEVALLMKGDLHTDELMHAVVAPRPACAPARRISHVYLMDVPDYPRPLLLTDAAINIAPTLEDKGDIVQNAIDLAHVIGIAQPRVAILAAVETVNDRDALDARRRGAVQDGRPRADHRRRARRPAGLRQRDQRGGRGGEGHRLAGRRPCRYPGGARSRGRQHAGQAAHLPGGAEAAGIVLGARVPIILTSRADSASTRARRPARSGVLVARAASGMTRGRSSP